jgi:hypothetical protein
MKLKLWAAATAAFFFAAPFASALAQEGVIRRNLAAQVPLFQKIDEARKTPMPGLYEVRTGTDLYYTDATGSFVIQGQDWMMKEQAAPAAHCDSAALARNVEFGKKYRITGTPTLFLSDGTRVPGAIGAQQLETLLAKAQP